VTLALVGVFTATLLPILTSQRRNWETAIGDAEITQTARVFMEHIDRQLAQAQALVAVSTPEASRGFLTFLDGHGQLRRYTVEQDGFIYYGAPTEPARLAGPVESLTFRCYTADDLRHATRQLDHVRLVDVTGLFAHENDRGRARSWHTQTYIRAPRSSLSDKTYAEGNTHAQGARAANK
jgi:hypothetical protein